VGWWSEESDRGKDAAWAAREFPYLAEGIPATARFLFLITPESFFIWRLSEDRPRDQAVAPDHVYPTTTFLGTYFDRMTVSPDELSGSAFEFLVSGWLGQLLLTLKHDPPSLAGYRELADSGWLDSIQNGHLEVPSAA
jgi:hypothetical protein